MPALRRRYHELHLLAQDPVLLAGLLVVGAFMLTFVVWPLGRVIVQGFFTAEGQFNLEQFHRHAMAEVLVRQKQVQGWRGEIRHSNVVTTHEQAQEPKAQQEAGREEAADKGEPTPREPSAKDQSAPVAAADEYTAADQGEETRLTRRTRSTRTI